MPTPFDPTSEDRYEPGGNVEETSPALEDSEQDDIEQETLNATPSLAPETTSEAPADPLLSTLPPEAHGETNGGPLGCCLGTVAGLFLTLSVILFISVTIGNGGYLGWTTGPVVLLGALVGGYMGWRIGKSIYREYELSPQRKARLERAEQQWSSRQKRSNKVHHPKVR